MVEVQKEKKNKETYNMSKSTTPTGKHSASLLKTLSGVYE